MTVLDYRIDSNRPFGEHSFGEHGQYRQLDGQVQLAVDPALARNRTIVDLEKVRRHDDGLVHFSADFSLVTPEDPARGNQRLIVDVPNRGNKLTASHFHQVAALRPEDRDNPGDGFLCQRGFSFLAIGWQWDVSFPGGLALEAPVAELEAGDQTGEVLMKLKPDADRDRLPLLAPGQQSLPYPINEQGPRRLYTQHGGRVNLIDRSDWHLCSEENQEERPGNTHIALKDGFRKGQDYLFVYHSRHSPVVGCGLIALRDIASNMKYGDTPNPSDRTFETLHAFGVSQTGRVLRHFLHEGLNTDEQGRPVYDGMLIHIAGGQRGDFNHRYGQPGVVGPAGFGQRFPFAANPVSDPITSRSEGLFDRLDKEMIPKVIFSNTSWEYWRGDASLIHCHEGKDLTEHPATRIYHIAGTHHIGGILHEGKQLTRLPTGLATAQPLNVVNGAPVFRALFTVLDEWVVDGTLPPDSRHPRLSDGSAVSREAILNRFGELGTRLDAGKLPAIHRMTFSGPEAVGVTTQPVELHEPYQAYVSNVGENLNEVSGIQLPDVACPLGCHSGWNPRDDSIGAPDELATFAGFTRFFPKEKVLSAYPDEAAYLEVAGVCIDSLIADRFVLPEDRQWMLNIARSRYQAALSAEAED